jgi:hypothetical protein
MTDNEIAKVGVLVSKEDQPVQPPLPRYATDIMPLDLTEEDDLQQALQNSVPQPPPPPPPPTFNLWAAPPPPPAFNLWAAPPPPPVAPTHVPPVTNWPWQILDFVVLNDDEE